MIDAIIKARERKKKHCGEPGDGEKTKTATEILA